MPCWTKTMFAIDTGKALDLDRLAEELTAAGYRIIGYHAGKETIDFIDTKGRAGTAYRTGRIAADTIEGVNAVRQHYAAATIKAAGKRFGWKAQNEKASAPNTLQITLRR